MVQGFDPDFSPCGCTDHMAQCGVLCGRVTQTRINKYWVKLVCLICGETWMAKLYPGPGAVARLLTVEQRIKMGYA